MSCSLYHPFGNKIAIRLGQNIVLALLYFVGGSLGMLLAFPPSNASPVWPASGIALAGIYIYGKKVLPGIFIGSCLIQIYAFGDFSSADKLQASLLIGAITGIGSTLQAFFGATLVNRFVGRADPLISDRKIITFLALGGPVACVTSSSIGIATLTVKNILSVGDIALSWLIWWVGDVIGVLVFTPIMLVFCAQPKALWKTRHHSVGYPMILSIAAVSLLFHFGNIHEIKRVRTAFTSQVDLFHDSLHDELGDHLAANETLKTLFDASDTVTQDEFHLFADFLINKHPHLKFLARISKMPGEQKRGVESPALTGLPLPEKSPLPGPADSQERKAHYRIAYLAPLAGHEALKGIDIGAHPQVLENLRQAAANNQTVAAPWPFGSNNNGAPSFAVYSPLYAPSPRRDHSAERHGNPIGFTLNVFRLDQQIAEIYDKVNHPPLLLQIREKNRLLYDNADNSVEHRLNFPRFQDKRLLRFANHIWEIDYAPSPRFYHGQLSWAIWWLLLGGFSFTSFVGCGLLMLTGRALRTEEIVRDRTRELEIEVGERKRMIRQHEYQNKILRAVASQKPLAEILELIVQSVEKDKPGTPCSILLLDREGKHLRHGASIGLPETYVQAVESLEIGPGEGSCGHAAATGQTTIAENVFEHPYWRNYRSLAETAKIVSCWSIPILSSTGPILGTFAFYSRRPATPTPADMARIEELSQITRIAIDHYNYEDRITHLAFYDALTELPNRRRLLDELEKEFIKTQRHKTLYALLYLDLDNFKTLNDSLGHEIGDELIRQVARRLNECIRKEDTVARLGGDEFIALLRGTTTSPDAMYNLALNLAQRIQEALIRPYMLQGHEHHITSSIGISIFPEGQTSAMEILKQADTAMYSAKSGGRNMICFYHAGMQEKADRRLEIEKDIRLALAEQQFSLHFQPQFDIDQRMVGAEALLRWFHPQKGEIKTPELIAIAEETGLILPISEWVIQEACRKIKQWPALQHLSLNISPRHFRQPDFIDRFKSILDDSGVPGERLILELTESCLIENTDSTIAKMKTLQAMNIGFSIDDFGTGYSSLSYLKSLPLNQIKIDQSFVRDICIDPNDAVIVETILLMSRSLGLEVIAEGVENEAQLQFLKARGCMGFQGYYFSLPMTAEDFEALYMLSAKPGLASCGR
jgi:diguanylate cyclase (GGDEF)-like protein